MCLRFKGNGLSKEFGIPNTFRSVLVDIYSGVRKGRGDEQGGGLPVLSVTATAGMRAVAGWAPLASGVLTLARGVSAADHGRQRG